MSAFFDSAITGTLAVLVGLFAILLVFFSWNFNYWRKRGVPYPTPLPFFGNLLFILLGRESFVSLLRPICAKFKNNGYCGFFQWGRPALLVYDTDIVKQMLTKDFSNFHDRGQPYDPEGDPLTAHLFNLEGTQWRNLRHKMSPTFTSGKLKLMFPLMVDVAEEMKAVIRENIKKEKEIDLKNYLTRYATDLIGSCAFGIQCNSLRGDDTEFVRMSREVFRPNFILLTRIFLSTIDTKWARLIPFKYAFPKTTSFFVNLMKDTVEYREKNNVVRNDFVHLMMQLREADKGETDRENHLELNHGILAAQGFIFFLAGLDSVTNTVSWALHELSLNPSLQEKAVNEIKTAMATTEGKITYESLKKMDLTDRILRETLRKWTPVGLIFRTATRNTQLGDTGLVVEKGIPVLIASDAIHYNPDIYPDPERFDPDRFTEEAKQIRHPYAYLPFGEGPRICIAERFAMLEMKLALASLLDQFKFSVGSKTELIPKIDRRSFGPAPINGFWLAVEPRV